MNRITYWMTASLVLLAAACGGEDIEATPEEDACEHMIEGPSQSLTAAALDATSDIPVIDEEHVRFDITLADIDGTNAGKVDLAIDEAGDHVLFLNAAVSLSVTDSTGGGVAAEAMESDIAACSEVGASYTFDLEVGTYTLDFESTQQGMVQLVLIPAGEHGHE